MIGAVSPPGGDLSEPVAQNTMRIVKVFWGLDANLAYQRHFPAINWLNSYSLYTDQIKESKSELAGGEWLPCRNEAMKLLNENEELQEIVSLVGAEALTPEQQLTLRMARSMIEDFLMQDAFSEKSYLRFCSLTICHLSVMPGILSQTKPIKFVRNGNAFRRNGWPAKVS